MKKNKKFISISGYTALEELNLTVTQSPQNWTFNEERGIIKNTGKRDFI